MTRAFFLLGCALGVAYSACTWTSQCYLAGVEIDVCGNNNKVAQAGCNCKEIPFVGRTCAGLKFECCDCTPGVDCACDWWDVKCNWADISTFFVTSSDSLKESWNELSTNVQTKIRESKFGDLTKEDLHSMGSDILSQLKSVSQMTKAQLVDIKEKVATVMSSEEFTNFISHLDTAVLLEALPELKTEHWTPESAAAALAELRKQAGSGLSGEVSTWTKEQFAKIGTFVAGLSATEIEGMDLETFKACMAQFRDARWSSSLDKLRVVTARTKEVFGDAKTWTVEQLNQAGSALAGLGERELPSVRIKLLVAMDDDVFLNIDWTVNPNALRAILPTMAQVRGWGAKAKGILAAAKKTWGAASEWTAPQLDALGSLIREIDEDDLKQLSNRTVARMTRFWALAEPQLLVLAEKLTTAEALALGAARKLADLSPAALEKVLTRANIAADKLAPFLRALGNATSWTREQAAVIFKRVAANPAIGQVSTWTKAKIEALGTLLGPLLREGAGHIQEITVQIFKEAGPAIIAAAHWARPELEALAAKAKEAYGAVSTWTKEQLEVLGPVLVVLGAEVKQLSAAALKAAIPAMSTAFDWSTTQLADLLARIKSSEVFGDVSTWTKDTLEKLGPMLRVVLKDDIPKLTSEVFKQTMAFLATACQWSKPQLKQLATKAKEALGPVSQWTKEQIKDLGAIIAGLDLDLPKLTVTGSVTLEPAAVDEMEPAEAAQLPAPTIEKLSERTRAHLVGEKLLQMSSAQRIAAVCGSDRVSCPQLVVDTILNIRSTLLECNGNELRQTLRDTLDQLKARAGFNATGLSSTIKGVISRLTPLQTKLGQPGNITVLVRTLFSSKADAETFTAQADAALAEVVATPQAQKLEQTSVVVDTTESYVAPPATPEATSAASPTALAGSVVALLAALSWFV